MLFIATANAHCLEFSNISEPAQDISLISNTSISDPLSSQFSLPTPSRIASDPLNPPQGPICIIERLLSQAHWNHSFVIVNSSPSFQSSLPLSFQGAPPIITLSSNSPTPDPDQSSHHCIRKHPDTTRNYPTLPLKFDPKLVFPPSALSEIIKTANNSITGLNNESLNHTKLHPYRNKEHKIYSNSRKFHFLLKLL